MISDSVSGYCAEQTICCDEASTTDTLIEDVPISIPSNNIIKGLKFNYPRGICGYFFEGPINKKLNVKIRLTIASLSKVI
jgi:hypothetical protein